jgi:hypothetical protein
VAATSLPLQSHRRRQAQERRDRHIGARHGTRESAFFPSQVFSSLLMHWWVGLDGFLFLILLASHNNTKQLGLLIFLSSKVRWFMIFLSQQKSLMN